MGRYQRPLGDGDDSDRDVRIKEWRERVKKLRECKAPPWEKIDSYRQLLEEAEDLLDG